MKNYTNITRLLPPLLLLLLLLLLLVSQCSCGDDQSRPHSGGITKNNTGSTLCAYKLTAICAILIAGATGVSIPILGRNIPSLHPDNNTFLLLKSFAAGVILATGFVHILPDAFRTLHPSPCQPLGQGHHQAVPPSWKDFPFAGFIPMASALGTMMIDAFATGYHKMSHSIDTNNNNNNKPSPVAITASGDMADKEASATSHLHVHTHTSHGHAHSSASAPHNTGTSPASSDLIRHRIVTQVLEIGIVIHSVIIGVSLGASQSRDTIKPIIVALTFHQLFEGIGLGGCISQAKFEGRTVAAMVLYFAATTPAGIGVGMGISKAYAVDEGRVVEGLLNAASAGILIYMALVDLIAADYMSQRMLANPRLQAGASLSLLLGSASMSLLAKWA